MSTRGPAKPKHWDDHADPVDGQVTWLDRYRICTTARLLAGELAGQFGCGNTRTLGHYEDFAGINFRHRRIQEYTRLNLEPPNPVAPADWYASRPCHVTLQLEVGGLPAAARDAVRLWDVYVYDAAGNCLRPFSSEQGWHEAIIGSPGMSPEARLTMTVAFARAC
jgi:hypothetical protein